MVAAAKVLVLTCMAGICALVEIVWCLMLVLLGGIAAPPMSLNAKPPSGVSLDMAEAEVAKVMQTLGTISWECPQGDMESGGASSSSACAICLDDFETGCSLTMTPCHHAFHSDCLKDWLVSSMFKWKVQSCAVCRRDLREQLESQSPPRADAPAEAQAPQSEAAEQLDELPQGEVAEEVDGLPQGEAAEQLDELPAGAQRERDDQEEVNPYPLADVAFC